MLTVTVDDAAVRGWLTAMPDKVRTSLERAVYTLTQKLRSHVVQDKLMGQVLNRVTGKLGQSIQDRVETSATSVIGTVYSAGNLVYPAIHEYGLTVQRRMEMAWGKPMRYPRDVTINYPERSFMRSSLADYKDEIERSMKLAVAEGARP